MIDHINVIAFDADDTLWVNEPYFQETEDRFCSLLEDYLPRHTISQELFKTEMANLELYGYGIKAYILSMIETVLRVSGNTLQPEVLLKVIEYGREMLNKPIELLDGVETVLKALTVITGWWWLLKEICWTRNGNYRNPGWHITSIILKS